MLVTLELPFCVKWYQSIRIFPCTMVNNEARRVNPGDAGRRYINIWAAIDEQRQSIEEQQQSMERLEAMLQQQMRWQPNPNTPTSNTNAHAPANRDGVKGVALGRPGGGRPPRAARHVQFEDFSDEDSDKDFTRYQGNHQQN